VSIIILTVILSLGYLIMGIGFYYLAKPKMAVEITPFIVVTVILIFPAGLICFGVNYFFVGDNK